MLFDTHSDTKGAKPLVAGAVLLATQTNAGVIWHGLVSLPCRSPASWQRQLEKQIERIN